MRDRRITLLQPGTGTDTGYGTEDGDHETVASVWAEYMPLAASERVEAMRDTGNQMVRFRILKDSDWDGIDNSWRVQFDGDTHDIKAVAEKERGFLILDCVRAD